MSVKFGAEGAIEEGIDKFVDVFVFVVTITEEIEEFFLEAEKIFGGLETSEIGESGDEQIIDLLVWVVLYRETVDELSYLEKTRDVGERSLAERMTIEQLDTSECAPIVLFKNLKSDMGEKIYLTPPLGFDRPDSPSVNRDLAFFESIDSEEAVSVFDDMTVDDDAREFLVAHKF